MSTLPCRASGGLPAGCPFASPASKSRLPPSWSSRRRRQARDLVSWHCARPRAVPRLDRVAAPVAEPADHEPLHGPAHHPRHTWRRINDNTTPDLWLTHDSVGLGPLRADLAETYWRWENSLPVMAGYARQTPESLTERVEGLEAQQGAPTRPASPSTPTRRHLDARRDDVPAHRRPLPTASSSSTSANPTSGDTAPAPPRRRWSWTGRSTSPTALRVPRGPREQHCRHPCLREGRLPHRRYPTPTAGGSASPPTKSSWTPSPRTTPGHASSKPLCSATSRLGHDLVHRLGWAGRNPARRASGPSRRPAVTSMTRTHLSNPVLVVVDVQNGFVNQHSEHAVGAVVDLVTTWTARGLPVVFTRYLNQPGSAYEKYFSWSRLMDSPEIDLVPESSRSPSEARHRQAWLHALQ